MKSIFVLTQKEEDAQTDLSTETSRLSNVPFHFSNFERDWKTRPESVEEIQIFLDIQERQTTRLSLRIFSIAEMSKTKGRCFISL